METVLTCHIAMYPRTIVTLLIMNLGKVMQGSFERIYALMNAKATEYTTTIPVLVYRWGIEGGKLSEATRVGIISVDHRIAFGIVI